MMQTLGLTQQQEYCIYEKGIYPCIFQIISMQLFVVQFQELTVALSGGKVEAWMGLNFYLRIN